jgi:hypothetical protein
MLMRFLEQTAAVPEEIEQMSFAALIRTGAERGVLKSGWNQWKAFREARNMTSPPEDRSGQGGLADI